MGRRRLCGVSSPALQQPQWPDRDRLQAVVRGLEGLPPLVLAAECDQLKERLAAVARGEAFLLQGGDCAETFAGTTADSIRGKFQTLLQMAVVLTYAASVPVVKVGRMAGQFGKPRSAATEVRDGVELPVYRGDAVNGLEFTAASQDARPGPAARGLPLRVGDVEPVPVARRRRLRRPAPGARLEPGLRGRQPGRAALRAAGGRDRPGNRVHARVRGRPAGVPGGGVLLQPRGPAAGLRAGADPDRRPQRAMSTTCRLTCCGSGSAPAIPAARTSSSPARSAIRSRSRSVRMPPRRRCSS